MKSSVKCNVIYNFFHIYRDNLVRVRGCFKSYAKSHRKPYILSVYRQTQTLETSTNTIKSGIYDVLLRNSSKSNINHLVKVICHDVAIQLTGYVIVTSSQWDHNALAVGGR